VRSIFLWASRQVRATCTTASRAGAAGTALSAHEHRPVGLAPPPGRPGILDGGEDDHGDDGEPDDDDEEDDVTTVKGLKYHGHSLNSMFMSVKRSESVCVCLYTGCKGLFP